MAHECVIRIAGMRAPDLCRARAHSNRDSEAAKEIEVLSSSKIDSARTRLNKILRGSSNLQADLKSIIDSHEMVQKNSTKVAVEVVATHGQDFFATMTLDQTYEWAEKTTKVFEDICKEQDKGVVAHAVLHLDETTPHLHIYGVPLVESFKGSRFGSKSIGKKINYDKAWGDTAATLAKAKKEKRSDTDTKLGRLQTDFAVKMQEAGFDVVRGTRNSLAVHQSIKEHKAKIADIENQKAKDLQAYDALRNTNIIKVIDTDPGLFTSAKKAAKEAAQKQAEADKSIIVSAMAKAQKAESELLSMQHQLRNSKTQQTKAEMQLAQAERRATLLQNELQQLEKALQTVHNTDKKTLLDKERAIKDFETRERIKKRNAKYKTDRHRQITREIHDSKALMQKNKDTMKLLDTTTKAKTIQQRINSNETLANVQYISHNAERPRG